MFSGKVKLLLRGLVTLILLAVVISKLDMGVLSSTLGVAQISILALGLLVQTGLLLIATKRWQAILTNFMLFEGYWSLLRLFWIGIFFNQFLPSSIGGDVVRTYVLAKEKKVSMATTLSVAVLERNGGLGALILIGLAAAWAGQISVYGLPVIYVYTILAAIYILINLVLFNRVLHRFLSRILRRFHLQDLDKRLMTVSNGLKTFSQNARMIGFVLLLSIFIQVIGVLLVWISARALRIEAPFSLFFVFVPLINLSLMIPLTINGYGLREGLFLLFFSQAGLLEETAIAMSLLTTCIVLATAVPGGLLYALYQRDKSRDLSGSQITRH